MSETRPEQTDAAPPSQDAPEPPESQIEAQETETPEAPDDASPPPPPPKKPSQGDRRFANLTARAATLEAERDAAHRRAEAAEALLNAGRELEQQPTRPPAETVDQAAERLVAQREFTSALNAIVSKGAAEFGVADWNEKTAVLSAMGATTNNNFLGALVGLPNATQLVAALADDTDSLASILRKTSVAMAAEMGRMAAKLETSTPAPKPTSRAPRPPDPVQARTVTPEIDPYKIKTAADWKAYRLKTAPKNLGGRG